MDHANFIDKVSAIIWVLQMLFYLGYSVYGIEFNTLYRNIVIPHRNSLHVAYNLSRYDDLVTINIGHCLMFFSLFDVHGHAR